jgi:hypothetical protein
MNRAWRLLVVLLTITRFGLWLAAVIVAALIWAEAGANP